MGCIKLRYDDSMKFTFDGREKGYRFGFNGKEKVDEIAGVGNHNTALFWEYDTRLGRRWNLDPVDQVRISNYACLGNNPINYTYLLGDKFVNGYSKDLSSTVLELSNAKINYEDVLKNNPSHKHEALKRLNDARYKYKIAKTNYDEVESYLATFNLVNPFENDYFEKLEENIDVSLNENSTYGGSAFATTLITPIAENSGEGKDKIIGIDNNTIKVVLYKSGRDTKSLANALGDIKYYKLNVVTVDDYYYMIKYGNPEFSGQEEYEQTGAGKYSFDYDEKFYVDFQKFVKEKGLIKKVDYDPNKYIIFNKN